MMGNLPCNTDTALEQKWRFSKSVCMTDTHMFLMLTWGRPDRCPVEKYRNEKCQPHMTSVIFSLFSENGADMYCTVQSWVLIPGCNQEVSFHILVSKWGFLKKHETFLCTVQKGTVHICTTPQLAARILTGSRRDLIANFFTI